MRILFLSAVVALGCRGSAPSELGPIYRFLPASPDLVIRVDLVRLRAWPMYAEVAPRALRNVQTMLDGVKTVCNLDVVAGARTIMIAKRGSLLDGDLTLGVTGLTNVQVSSCLAALQKADSQHQLTVDGTAFHVNRNGKSLGSGGLLGSGELVFVVRNGAGVEPAAWKTELTAPSAAPPSWWTDLHATDPIAIRIAGKDKRAMFSAALDKELLVRGSVVSNTAQAAASDLKMYQAVVDYLKQADAGTARLELSGETMFADLRASGPQVERLLTMALPAMFGTDGPVEPTMGQSPAGGTADCASLAAAVESYLKTGLSLASASQKAEMTRVIPTLLPRLQKAFVDRCAADHWSAASIACHVTNSTELPRFEKCRNELSSEQREHLDKEITAAMSPLAGAPVTFELRAKATGSRARTATLTTLHDRIETPVFMPVGTRASVRTQPLSQLERLGPSIILANTYHLMVQPGIELFQQLGGLHRWMGWTRSVLTDSGGFQIFSLPHTMSEHGAEVRNYNGTRHVLTPERSIAVQRAIGSDIMMVLDECIDSTSSHARAKAAMDLTHRWAQRSLDARGDSSQLLFGIVQGACFEDLRRTSAYALTEMRFDGYAIGGLAVGEHKAQREDITELVAGLLPEQRPRYLMGVGTPLDLLEAVHRGVDMFDCTLPTAWAQQGIAFTSHGKIDLRRGVHKLSERPLDASCDCEACGRHTRSYLRHLMKTKEPLGWQLLAFHNLRFYLELMREIRARIADDSFAAFYAERRTSLGLADIENPPGRQPKRKSSRKARTRAVDGQG